LENLRPLTWLPDSLTTKIRHGFRADSEIEDGSSCSTQIIEELAVCEGRFIDKVYALYACGVAGYEGKIFSPKQLISMMVHQNPYQVGQVCRWIGGIRTESGVIYGPSPQKKQAFLESLCNTLDEWTPSKFKNIPDETKSDLKERLKSIPAEISDYQLAVYLVANYAQFVQLIIHPFWNRNGRHSEEVMHLFCLSNSAVKRPFWQDVSQRYNSATSSRMELVNQLGLELLTEILGELGTDTNPNSALTTGLKQYFLKEGRLSSRVALTCLSPYLYRFVAQRLTPRQLSHYFECLESKIEKMISKLAPESFSELIKEETALRLLDHHLLYGVPTPVEP